jgi:hypothetical protein
MGGWFALRLAPVAGAKIHFAPLQSYGIGRVISFEPIKRSAAFRDGSHFHMASESFFNTSFVLEVSLMDNETLSGSSGSDDRMDGADSPDHEPEPQKKPPQKTLTSDPKRQKGRPHQIRYIKARGPKRGPSSTR